MLRKAIEAEYKRTILTIIDKKVEEHKVEIQGATNQIETLQSKLSNKNTVHKDSIIKVARQLGMLKDKVVFHKACVAALTDLKVEL